MNSQIWFNTNLNAKTKEAWQFFEASTVTLVLNEILRYFYNGNETIRTQ